MVISTVSPEFVRHMEDVLDLYAIAEDPLRPRVCFDECPCESLNEARQLLPGPTVALHGTRRMGPAQAPLSIVITSARYQWIVSKVLRLSYVAEQRYLNAHSTNLNLNPARLCATLS